MWLLNGDMKLRAMRVLTVVTLILLLNTASSQNESCYDSCCFASPCPDANKCPTGYIEKAQTCHDNCCVPPTGSSSCCKLNGSPTPTPPTPTPGSTAATPTTQQMAWQDYEVGALNSFQIVTFYDGQLKSTRPFDLATPGNFTPYDLAPEQWAQAALAMGAKYHVLNVKDESGFLLYPSKCGYDYSIASSPVFNQSGDLLQRFVLANEKHGIRSGIYYLTWGNFYLNMSNENGDYDCSHDTPQTRSFEKMTLCQIEEIYTQYGEMAEIWFDGGSQCRPEFEAAILNLTLKYQPDAVAFQGPVGFPNDVRWVGNEDGQAASEQWSAALSSQDYGPGTRDGPVWTPAEADTCIRTASSGAGSSGCWLWYPNSTVRSDVCINPNPPSLRLPLILPHSYSLSP